MSYTQTVGGHRYSFDTLKTLMAKATPARSGDYLAGVAAGDDEERAAAQIALADVPLKLFLVEHVVPYEADEVTRLIVEYWRSSPQRAMPFITSST
jgi:ethanolamine ammonia-lyase large subunit